MFCSIGSTPHYGDVPYHLKAFTISVYDNLLKMIALKKFNRCTRLLLGEAETVPILTEKDNNFDVISILHCVKLKNKIPHIYNENT